MNQTQEIISYIKQYGSITPLDALRDLGCMRLAARIQEARDSGHKIETAMENNGAKRYARYYFRGQEEQCTTTSTTSRTTGKTRSTLRR